MIQCFNVPGPSFQLKLSQFDARIPPVYSKRILLFPLPETSHKHKNEITDLLHEALQATVQALPFLAASVEPATEDRPWLHHLQCQGAARLEVCDLSQNIDYHKLRQGGSASSLLESDQLCPKAEDPVGVCRLRANFVTNGLILVVSIAHTVCDGRGITEVLNVFTKKLCYRSNTKFIRREEHEHFDRVYKLDRTSVLCIKQRHLWYH